MKNILIIISALLLTISCSNKTKKTLGLIETIPDEYQVTRNKPLEVPPHYNLEDIASANSNKITVNSLSDSEKAIIEEAEIEVR